MGLRRLLASVLRRVAGADLASDILGDLEELRRTPTSRGHVTSIGSSLARVGAVTAYFVGAALAALARDAWPPGQWLGGPDDLTVAARSLRRTPWYAATVIGVIALTTTLATTVFAVVDGILFKPLPFADAGQLFVVRPWHRGLDPHVGSPLVSPQDLADWQAALPEVTFSGLRTPSASGKVPFGENVNAPEVAYAEVDRSFLSVLGVAPRLGGFTPEHFTRWVPGVPRAALVTHDLWVARFGADPALIGRTMVIDEPSHQSVQIVGVLPATFVFPAPLGAQLLLASAPTPAALADPRRRIYDEVIARIPGGFSPDIVRQRIERAMRQTAARFLAPPAGGWAVSDRVRFSSPYDEATLVPLDTFINARQRPLASAVFVGSVVLVLLGCVNVSGLIAARGRQREREVAARRALGAGRMAIVRFVFAEAALVTAIGTLLGVLVAWPTLRLTIALLPDSIHLLKPAAIDWRVLAFAALTTGLSALVVAVGPIRQTLRTSVTESLRGGSPSTPRDSRTGRIVITVQVAMGLTLAVGGALLVGSLIKVWSQSVGFDTDVTMISLTLAREPAAGGAADLAMALERVRAVPGVESAGVTDAIILAGATWGGVLAPPAGAPPIFLESHAVTSGFFDVMKPRLVEGRYPTAAELDHGAVLVVTEGVANAYWPGRSALGESLAGGQGESYRVVGVVADARYESWDRSSWVAYGSYPSLAMSNRPNLLVRSPAGRAVPVADILRVAAEVGPAVRVTRVSRLDTLLTNSIRPRQFESWLFGSFAAAALLVVCVGVLGIVGMAAARRTREVGIRMALGATREHLVSLLFREQLLAVAGGLATGGVFSAWAVQFVKAYMYELTVYDARLWIAAVIAIVLAASIGTAIPALRASRVNPVQALRTE